MRHEFDPVAFGERLRMAREQTGLSMNRVSQLIYISQSVISRYESGDVTPTIDRVCAMANLYGCSIDWLCGMEVDTHD